LPTCRRFLKRSQEQTSRRKLSSVSSPKPCGSSGRLGGRFFFAALSSLRVSTSISFCVANSRRRWTSHNFTTRAGPPCNLPRALPVLFLSPPPVCRTAQPLKGQQAAALGLKLLAGFEQLVPLPGYCPFIFFFLRRNAHLHQRFIIARQKPVQPTGDLARIA